MGILVARLHLSPSCIQESILAFNSWKIRSYYFLCLKHINFVIVQVLCGANPVVYLNSRHSVCNRTECVLMGSLLCLSDKGDISCIDQMISNCDNLLITSFIVMIHTNVTHIRISILHQYCWWMILWWLIFHVNEDYVKMILQGRCIILCSCKFWKVGTTINWWLYIQFSVIAWCKCNALELFFMHIVITDDSHAMHGIRT